MYVCVCVGRCVLWVADGMTLNLFEAAPEYLDNPLSIFSRRSHKEPTPRKLVRLEERTKDVVS